MENKTENPFELCKNELSSYTWLLIGTNIDLLKFEASGTNAFNLIQIFDLITDGELTFLIHKDKTIWPFCITTIIMIDRPCPFFRKEVALGTLNSYKETSPCPVQLKHDRLPHLVLSYDSTASVSLWTTLNFLMMTDMSRLAAAILTILAAMILLWPTRPLFKQQ